ncbi:MAG: hypothetical protein OEZ68_19335 [Gammaproteobacteria bacterium]|nr:hypothetical protein [Gammaproteobacteria bacterium]MDH5802963.1 hypothetical protein [Gammaproteobacteria bacterium]
MLRIVVFGLGTILLTACIALSSEPDPALIGSCQHTVDDATAMLKKAEQEAYTQTTAYIQSYKWITQAKGHLRTKQYSYCLQKASIAQRYLQQLLSTGRDI